MIWAVALLLEAAGHISGSRGQRLVSRFAIRSIVEID